MAKKKILLLSDDLRLHSGVGTVSKEFVRATIKEFDWVQLGGAIKHPEEGKIMDLSEAMCNELKINDGSTSYTFLKTVIPSKTSLSFDLPQYNPATYSLELTTNDDGGATAIDVTI